MEDRNTLYSKKQLNLEIELIINRNLYKSNKILKDTFSKVETGILRDIETEKNRNVYRNI